MKSIKRYILLLGALSMGCSDLEEEPVGLLSPEGFFKTPQDVQTMINGAIGNMAHERYWGRKLSHSLMLRSDMASIGDQGSPQRRRDVDTFQMLADNGMVSEFWPTSYQIIGGCNQAIAGAATLNVEPSRIDPITAQAYFFRAFTYYHLVRLFGDIPYLDRPVENLEEAKTLNKMPEAQVYENIIADLEKAKSDLPNTQPNRSLPSKATAAGYLASVFLTLGEYDRAYQEAKYVIDNEGTFDLGLEPDYQDLFDATKQGTSAAKEPLLELDYNSLSDGDVGRDYTPALTGIRADERGGTGGGWSVAVPTINVYNTWDGRDYRKAVSLDTIGIFNGVEEPFSKFPEFDSRNIASAYIAKYTRFIGLSVDGNGRSSAFNYPMMRYAEVLLIAAEALNETAPGSTEAAGYLNRVRARARNGNASGYPEDVPAGLSQTDFRDIVIEERKWELSFEFKRWYDIKRLRIGEQVFGPSGLEQQAFDPGKDYLFPLPADELERNPNLAPNNPGY
ncbi:RagB/SusD family nutrient uptake outer membrane protein [Flagellimonas sp.]|uniref:RagB/SusD family nutrient uptake outer membrane protein n=1 Tax=Flagellimonas sp. TaxID=2058762 RepID=UPI003AB8FE81